MIVRCGWIIRRPYDGFAIGRLIVVRPERANDADLIAHEAFHGEEQLRMGVVRWWWKYRTDDEFRVAAEVRAYRVSMQHGMRADLAAKWLMTYRAGMSFGQALALLTA